MRDHPPVPSRAASVPKKKKESRACRGTRTVLSRDDCATHAAMFTESRPSRAPGHHQVPSQPGTRVPRLHAPPAAPRTESGVREVTGQGGAGQLGPLRDTRPVPRTSLSPWPCRACGECGARHSAQAQGQARAGGGGTPDGASRCLSP